MSSSSGAEQILTSPTEQQANTPELTIRVMAKQTSLVEKYHQGNMDPHLLALASSGSSEELRTLLNGEDSQSSGSRSLPTRQAQSYGDIEANESILAGKTAEGDTALHVVAASGQGDNFFTTYGDSDNFLESARIIYRKVKYLLFEQNNEGYTPLHYAARAGKSSMVKCLVELALDEGEGTMKDLLRKENKQKETALHEAVRVGNKDIVDLLMGKDSELASFPQDGGTSPMYLAIILKQDLIETTLYEKSHGKLSFSGPNGQNALHAAVLRHHDLTKLLKWNEANLCPQNKDLTTQRDENGSTPLHFAAVIKFGCVGSRNCWQALEANPEALYQPDHAGFFPIHVAASVGAFRNVNMFVKKCPGSAGLRDAKGRTFLHVAVQRKEVSIIRSACANLSLSWIMNMVDNDGNTALHLAIEAGWLRMFCPLLGNPQVNINLPNNRGETPLDIAQYKIRGFHNARSSEAQICHTLRIVGAAKGVCRWDQLLQDNETVRVKSCDEIKEMDVLKDSTGTLCIGSVLITTVTFGATFAVPGGYIADDHSNGGSPILARRYVFHAFIASNTLAFVFSAMATIGLMYSGSPLLYPRSRRMHLVIAVYLLSISITSLAAAFALGAYVVLAPVAHKTAVATCVLSSLVVLYRKMQFVGRRLLLLPSLCKRKRLIWAWGNLAMVVMRNMLFEDWPLIFIFGWAAYAKPPFIQK